MGSIAEFAVASAGPVGSLVQHTGSTIVDTLSVLPLLALQVFWEAVFGVAQDLGSSMPV